MARGVGRPMAVLVLSDEERSYLERQARRRRVARSLSDRCRMILRCADGLTNKAVALELGVHEHTVGKWRRRFLKERIEGLSDEPRPGRPRMLTDEQVAAVIERTLETTPADATLWSLRSMARESGLSHTTVRRIWAAFSVQPHRSETFNTDQGSQFTSFAFTGRLHAPGIRISMDGRGRCMDNYATHSDRWRSRPQSSSGCGARSNTRRSTCTRSPTASRPGA